MSKLSRRKFITSHGATCNNWRNAWSFVNHDKREVIFGAWDYRVERDRVMIFSEDWQYLDGRKQNAYKSSEAHIALIENENYSLKIFVIENSDKMKDENGVGPSSIKNIIPILSGKILGRSGNSWYAYGKLSGDDYAGQIKEPVTYLEGATISVTVNSYERNSDARADCIAYWGPQCIVCDFNFEEFYGQLGSGFVHVHHLVPLATRGGQYKLNPIHDLRPVCPNCHAMLHRADPVLSIEALKTIIDLQKKEKKKKNNILRD